MCTAKPKIQAPAPVIERQGYKSPVSRASLTGADGDARRRMIAGIATSAQGVASPASTTRRVMTGGDQQLMPVLASGQSSPNTVPVVDTGTGPVTLNQSNPVSAKQRKNLTGYLALRPASGLIASRSPQLPNVS